MFLFRIKVAKALAIAQLPVSELPQMRTGSTWHQVPVPGSLESLVWLKLAAKRLCMPVSLIPGCTQVCHHMCVCIPILYSSGGTGTRLTGSLR